MGIALSRNPGRASTCGQRVGMGRETNGLCHFRHRANVAKLGAARSGSPTPRHFIWLGAIDRTRTIRAVKLDSPASPTAACIGMVERNTRSGPSAIRRRCLGEVQRKQRRGLGAWRFWQPNACPRPGVSVA